jgi:hypothetical protein
VSAIDARDQRGALSCDVTMIFPIFALAVALLACANITLCEHRRPQERSYFTLLVDEVDTIPVGHFLRAANRRPVWVAF